MIRKKSNLATTLAGIFALLVILLLLGFLAAQFFG
jgi:hypothetical protein